jgi:hypothetical protein
MLKKVKVIADKISGKAVVVGKNNPEYGYVRLEQEITIVEKNWLREKTLSCLINGKVKALEKDYSLGEISGKLYTIETLEPTNPDDVEDNTKKAGNTGIVLTINGAPIYASTYWTEDLSISSELLQHDNKAEIQAYYAAKKAEEAEM